MTQNMPDKGRTEAAAAPDFAALAKQRFEEFSEMQSEILDDIRQANKKWLERVEAEAALASEFTTKLTASHSIPETATVCQEWGKRRMELMAEDRKNLMADSQKFMTRTAQLLSGGWLPNGKAGGGA